MTIYLLPTFPYSKVLPMSDTDSKAHLRINHVDENIKEIKETVKENSRDIKAMATDLSGLKSTVRIAATLLFSAVAALIAIVLSSLLI